MLLLWLFVFKLLYVLYMFIIIYRLIILIDIYSVFNLKMNVLKSSDKLLVNEGVDVFK